MRDGLGPLPLGLAAAYLLYPHRRQPLAMRLLTVAIVFTLLWVVRRLGPVLTPFFVAFLLAYLLDPLVRKLTSWRIPRVLAALLPLLVALVAIILVIAFVLPPIVTQAIEFVGQLPDLIQTGLDRIEPLARRWIERFGGGPVGVGSIASSIAEDKGTIEDLYEPYLIQIGFLNQ